MPGGRIIVSPLTAEEAHSARLFNLVGWSACIILFTWIAWAPPDIATVKALRELDLHQKIAFEPAPRFSTIWAIVISLTSPLIGWLLGWKWGIHPLFTGQIMTIKPESSPTT